MADKELTERLETFVKEFGFRTKGPLSVALVVTDHARNKGLPLNPEELLTARGGQVLGLGRQAVQAILKRHGIDRVLAAEGGRTSRGSIKNMRDYVAFLNALQVEELADVEAVESFWIGKVERFFAGKPFRLNVDNSKSLRVVIRDIAAQARQRQQDDPGTWYLGTVIQHLVGAKLECLRGAGNVLHNSYSTSDAQQGRVGDFHVGDVAIHVTTAPTEALMQRCVDNLKDGLWPVIVTLDKGFGLADGLADNASIGDRIDILDLEQFMATNFHELGGFVVEGRRAAVTDLITRYNAIIDSVETDPSLRIEFRTKKDA